MYIYIRISTYIHIFIYIYIHTYMLVIARVRVAPEVTVKTLENIRTHVCIPIKKSPHEHMYVYPKKNLHTCIRIINIAIYNILMHVCVHTFIYVCIYTYIHTCIRTCPNQSSRTQNNPNSTAAMRVVRPSPLHSHRLRRHGRTCVCVCVCGCVYGLFGLAMMTTTMWPMGRALRATRGAVP